MKLAKQMQRFLYFLRDSGLLNGVKTVRLVAKKNVEKNKQNKTNAVSCIQPSPTMHPDAGCWMKRDKRKVKINLRYSLKL